MAPPLPEAVVFHRTAHDGRRIQISIDMLGYVAQILTPQLEDPLRPQCCAICLSICGAKLQKADCSVLLSYLLTNKHDFFDACIAILAAPRSFDDLTPMRAGLAESGARCPNTSWHPFLLLPQPVGDPLGLFLTGLLACVSSAFRNSQSKGWFKAQARKGIWPTSLTQLLPYGALPSVVAYAAWCRTLLSPLTALFLAVLLDLARSDVLPHLLVNPAKDILMEALILMLRGPRNNSGDDRMQSSLPMLPADHPRLIVPRTAAATLLRAILHGPATLRDDPTKLYAGHESSLYFALLSAVESNTLHDNKILVILCLTIQDLHELLALPPSRALSGVQERMLQCRRNLNVPQGVPTDAGLVFMILNRLAERKTCSGAGCHTAAKQACSRCGLVRYCGRPCQQLDWRVAGGEALGVTVTHKAVCPILCRLRDSGVSANSGGQSIQQSLPRFLELYRRADVSDEDCRELISWGIVAGFVPSGVRTDLDVTNPLSN